MAKPTRSKNERPDRKIIMAIDIGTVGTGRFSYPKAHDKQNQNLVLELTEIVSNRLEAIIGSRLDIDPSS